MSRPKFGAFIGQWNFGRWRKRNLTQFLFYETPWYPRQESNLYLPLLYHFNFHCHNKLCSWSGLCLNHKQLLLGWPCLVSTPSTFSSDLARHCHEFTPRGFTEFKVIQALAFAQCCPILFRRGLLYPFNYGGAASILAAYSTTWKNANSL